jgi:DNA replication protein DnaC
MAYNIGELSPLKRNWLYRNSNIPHRFLGLEPADIEKDKGAFPEEITDWVQSALRGEVIKAIGGLGVTGVGLLFDGSPGLGKTTHAVTAIMEFVRNLPENDDEMRKILGVSASDFGQAMRPVYYLTFPDFLSKKKATFDAKGDERELLIAEMEGFHGRSKMDHLNVRVLVLDDLGKEYGSKYDDSSFDEILRSRYDKALPTIITTNRDREDWEKVYGKAMGSFAFEAFHLVRLVGKDLRKEG